MFLPTVDPVLVDWVVEDMTSAPQEIALDALVHAFNNDGPVIRRLAELDLPVVAINADYEPTDAASLQRHGVRPVIVSGVSHF